jgi:sphingosine kinase
MRSFLHDDKDFVWPKEEAERAKLFVPQVYDPYQNQESPGKCFFQFDKERTLFTIVSETTGSILDIIDPDDVIGVDLEISMLGEDSFPKASTREEQYVNEPISDIPVNTQGAAVLTVFVYPKRDPSKESILSSCGFLTKSKPVTDFPSNDSGSKKPMGPRYPNHRKFMVAPSEDFADLSITVQAIRRIARPSSFTSPNERVLVIVNPMSGLKAAVEIYQKNVLPVFEQASLSHDFLITTHARHAEERMKQQPADGDIMDLSEYSGVIGIGGDGIIYEIMQGIHARSDRDEILKKVKLGMIGAGTSNGLSASLAHASEVSLPKIACKKPLVFCFCI